MCDYPVKKFHTVLGSSLSVDCSTVKMEAMCLSETPETLPLDTVKHPRFDLYKCSRMLSHKFVVGLIWYSARLYCRLAVVFLCQVFPLILHAQYYLSHRLRPASLIPILVALIILITFSEGLAYLFLKAISM